MFERERLYRSAWLWCSEEVGGALSIHTNGAMAQSVIEVSVTWRLCLLMWYCALRYYHSITYKEPVLKDKNEKENLLGNGLWHHNEGKAQLLG